MKVLFIITARGGSKGVPRKNIVDIGGLPLIAYKIISAKNSRFDKRIIVSTEDDEIAEIARQYGAEVPFKRPEELAADNADSMDVVYHAMKWIEKNDSTKYDFVCLLEPSSPFATADDYDAALTVLENTGKDTLLAVKEVDVNTRFIHELDEDGGLSFFYDAIKDLRSVRRQDQKKEYTPNGCMYIAKWDYFMKNRLFHSRNSIPYIMPEDRSIEIDTLADLEYARYLVKSGIISGFEQD